MSERAQVAADTAAADSGGQQSENAAAYLRELPQDFKEAVAKAKGLLKHDPTIAGWDGFGEEHETHMESVRRHAATLAGNIRSGAGRIDETDEEAEAGFGGQRRETYRDGFQHLNPNIQVNRTTSGGANSPY
ncbi:hypothetical protein [Nocardiopsis metallicus]|uniref:Uncharacterized protein n=1 Tax=Nocardiopsis metallicus TaxID=179819 RepID=A0A840WA60_9ACTN|nr:hypothetical protein [Nocardiopsis metallicus]MBB5492982.1 hypothetical protein [Nocardiopsis metallicus]